MGDIENKRLDALIRHIDNVKDRCLLLGERLISRGEDELGRHLVANGYIHDHSKFSGIEWLYLHQDIHDKDPDKFLLAASQHVSTNKHHPEYWGSIHEMPRIYTAEMVADWASRSAEFGNDLRSWCRDKATTKYKMTVQSKTYKEIKDLVDILLDPAFK